MQKAKKENMFCFVSEQPKINKKPKPTRIQEGYYLGSECDIWITLCCLQKTLQAALKTKPKAWQCQNRATQEVLLVLISIRKQNNTTSSNQSIMSAKKISKLPKLKMYFSLSPNT